MHDGNAFRLDQRQREVFIALDHLAFRRRLADTAFTGRIYIEGAFWHRAFQTLRLIEHGDDKVAPRLECFRALRNEILRAVQRLNRRPLADRSRVRGGLALHLRHRLDELLWPGAIADTPARHRISFRHTVHGERAVIETRLHLNW